MNLNNGVVFVGFSDVERHFLLHSFIIPHYLSMRTIDVAYCQHLLKIPLFCPFNFQDKVHLMYVRFDVVLLFFVGMPHVGSTSITLLEAYHFFPILAGYYTNKPVVPQTSIVHRNICRLLNTS